jgi:hypothetical protein
MMKSEFPLNANPLNGVWPRHLAGTCRGVRGTLAMASSLV